jgi:predicted DNA-binding protein
MVRTNVYLPRKVRDIYKKLASKTGTTMAELLREDINSGIKNRVRKHRAAAEVTPT